MFVGHENELIMTTMIIRIYSIHICVLIWYGLIQINGRSIVNLTEKVATLLKKS